MFMIQINMGFWKLKHASRKIINTAEGFPYPSLAFHQQAPIVSLGFFYTSSTETTSPQKSWNTKQLIYLPIPSVLDFKQKSISTLNSN